MRTKLVAGMAAVTAVVVTSTAWAGPEWVEDGDAGPTTSTAQKTRGTRGLNSIVGSLSSAIGFGAVEDDFEDMFLIRVVEPTTFTMTVGNAGFDPQLFIFNVTQPGEGLGLLANNDTDAGNLPFLSSIATDGTGAQINLPGIYAIAISGLGRVPVSDGGELFNFANMTEISGADGPGGLLPHIGWTGIGETGTYRIDFTSADTAVIPTPGALPMLALALLAAKRRRRSGK